MPDPGKRKGNSVLGGMRWEWEEEVVELPVKGMLRIDVHAHATGESVDDSRPVEKPTSQKLSPSTASGTSLDKASWTTTVTGVVSTARSDLMQACATAWWVRRRTILRGATRKAGRATLPDPQRAGDPGTPGTPVHRARPSIRPDPFRRIADALSRLHTDRGDDRDVHRRDHVRDRLQRDQPGASRSRVAECLAGTRDGNPARHARDRPGLCADERSARARHHRLGPAHAGDDRRCAQ